LERRAEGSACAPTRLSAIKYVCKNLWQSVHEKNVDKLETDNRGMYVLHDDAYQWLCPLASVDAAESHDEVIAYMRFSCGFVRGAFAALGWTCTVEAKISNLPACQFQCTFKEEEGEGR